MEWKEVAATLLIGGWSCIGLWVARSIKEISDSVQALNLNVALVVQRVEQHEKRLEKLEEN